MVEGFWSLWRALRPIALLCPAAGGLLSAGAGAWKCCWSPVVCFVREEGDENVCLLLLLIKCCC